MNGPNDKQIVAHAVGALQGRLGAIDAIELQRLNRARNAALMTGFRRKVSPWLWASAAAAAAVVALTIGLENFNGADAGNAMLAQQVLAEPELYEEMEFYLWLSAELETE